MHEHVSNNKHYEKGKSFVEAIKFFFNTTVHEIKEVIRSRVTDNFQRLNTQIPNFHFDWVYPNSGLDYLN